MKHDEAYCGLVVTVDGYGGWATIQNIYEDGVGPSGAPKFRATVKWGANNRTPGRARYTGVEDFPLGKLHHTHEVDTSMDDLLNIDDLTEAELIARIQQINEILGVAS